MPKWMVDAKTEGKGTANFLIWCCHFRCMNARCGCEGNQTLLKPREAAPIEEFTIAKSKQTNRREKKTFDDTAQALSDKDQKIEIDMKRENDKAYVFSNWQIAMKIHCRGGGSANLA